LWLLLGVLAVAAVVIGEVRSSVGSAQAWAARARALTYVVGAGQAPVPLASPTGPYDQRLGYTALPRISDSLAAGGFTVTRQARPSAALIEYASNGYAPPYPAKVETGLALVDRQGRPLFRSVHPRHTYPSFDAIPPSVVEALLWIEDRELLAARYPSRNPALDWDRLARAFGELALRVFDGDRRVPGGSTLATQIEKFRHSPGGRTAGMKDKWRQIVSASIRVYQGGTSTLDDRQRIVLEYLNSVPLAAHPRTGEVTGIGEGLDAWFSADPAQVNAALWAMDTAQAGHEVSLEQAGAYRQVLSLILSERRPSDYLRTESGAEALADLTDQHLRRFLSEGVIAPELARRALEQRLLARPTVIPPTSPLAPLSLPERKALTTLRTRVAVLLGVESAYALDRMDLRVTATLDSAGQAQAGALLSDLHRPEFVRTRGLNQTTLVGPTDPSRVLHSILVMQSGPDGNRVVVDADNLPGAASLNEAGRLELGSTAKLRTLVTYLETNLALFDRLSPLTRDSLQALEVHPRDRLTGWVVETLLADPGLERAQVLDRAMERRYRADPGERFQTGGGIQVFRNFDRRFDNARPTVREAFRQSVNLVFVRMMRDVTDHHIFAPWSTTSQVLAAPDSVRRPYLMRFAQAETGTFVRRFYRTYVGLDSLAVREALLENRRSRPRQAAWALRWVAPELDVAGFTQALRHPEGPAGVSATAWADHYRITSPSGRSLSDVAYLSSVHPLELWVAGRITREPAVTLDSLLVDSEALVEDIYGWLLDRTSRARQNPRIYSVLEEQAFSEVLAGWRRLGYPFRNLVPSIGTAIGSSGDRPTALAELVGIVVNGGVRLPPVRVTELEFGLDTPYDVAFSRDAITGQRVMDPATARTVREAMIDVVDNGTGRRARGALRDRDQQVLTIGGKTGTGDNRVRSGGPGGGEGRVVNRTSTFVFFAGERAFGVVTAYVPGAAADDFAFTSALASQVLAEFGRGWEVPVAPH